MNNESSPPPSLWDWKLDLTPHLMKRMADRSFSEIDVRRMIEDAARPDVAGFWALESTHHGLKWEVVIRAEETAPALIVITAYSVAS